MYCIRAEGAMVFVALSMSSTAGTLACQGLYSQNDISPRSGRQEGKSYLAILTSHTEGILGTQRIIYPHSFPAIRGPISWCHVVALIHHLCGDWDPEDGRLLHV